MLGKIHLNSFPKEDAVNRIIGSFSSPDVAQTATKKRSLSNKRMRLYSHMARLPKIRSAENGSSGTEIALRADM